MGGLKTWYTRRLWATGLISVCVLLPVAACSKDDDEFIKLMNRGKAYLENRTANESVATFEAAVELNAESPAALRNLARAYMLAQKPAKAVATLLRARKLESESAPTSYLLGLAYSGSSRFAEAVSAFEESVRLDGHLATLRFQLANAYEATEQFDKALEQLRETVRLDPLHASAHYKLATRARREGDMEEFRRQFEEFQRLKKLFGDASNNREALMQCIYTQPEAAARKAAPRKPSRSTLEVRFQDDTDSVFASEADRAAWALCVLDVDEQGRVQLFTVSPGGPAIISMDPTGTFQRDAVEGGLSGQSIFKRCVVGDVHNDVPEGAQFDARLHARNDVLLAAETGVRLLKRQESLSFTDVTHSAGLAGAGAGNGRWVDYEHDGDLDLLLARAGTLALWQNNGNGTFEDVTAAVGLGNVSSVVDVAPVDLDRNNATDLVIIRGDKPTLVFINQRAGRFAPMAQPPGPWPAARHVISNDLNNDGHVDTVLFGEKEAVVLLGRLPQRAKIALTDVDVRAVAMIDIENDGWLDICAVGTDRSDSSRGVIRIWRNGRVGERAGVEWADVSDSLGVAGMNLPSLDGVLAGDLDGDGDTDLMLKTADGKLRLLRNEGGHQNGQLKIRLVSVKTNPTALSTHIELREGSFWVTRMVTGLPIEIGLGGRTHLDSIQTVWTNGVVDNQIDVAVGAGPLTIKEKVVATGSCPFLYAWDGRRFRFVTDILGNSPLGLSLHRGIVLDADPDEFVEIGDAESFVPLRGAYTVELTEETREVLYLDAARLVAVDHLPELEIHATDKLMPPPFPPSELWVLGNAKTPEQAIGSDGVDRTEAVGRLDGNFAPPGAPLPPPYRGLCHPMSLTLDFGPIDTSRPLVLALTGWLQYGDASTNIAVSQNPSIEPVWPVLEAETAPDTWRQVETIVGMPAGKTKTILCDLSGRLPQDTRRLRLTTSFEIRWDRIALFERRTLPREAVRMIPPDRANLYFRGFSEIHARGAGHPTTPDHGKVTLRPPWRTTPQGWCTRYGDALPLVAQRDGALAIINAGDALTLRFAEDEFPPVPAGMKRTFFFHTVGWDKDEDHNVVDGDTVEPIPTHNDSTDMAVSDDLRDWRLKYNTRWVPHEFTVPAP